MPDIKLNSTIVCGTLPERDFVNYVKPPDEEIEHLKCRLADAEKYINALKAKKDMLLERDQKAAAEMSARLCDMEERCETLETENKDLIRKIESLTKEKDELIRENAFYRLAYDDINNVLKYQAGLIDGLKYAIEQY